MAQRDLDYSSRLVDCVRWAILLEAPETLGGFQASSQAPSALQSIVRLAGGIASGSHRDQLKLVGIVEVKGK